MSRPNKIWFRKDIGWWMVTVDGKKIRLAEGKPNRKKAEQKFHELKAVQAMPPAPAGFFAFRRRWLDRSSPTRLRRAGAGLFFRPCFGKFGPCTNELAIDFGGCAIGGCQASV